MMEPDEYVAGFVAGCYAMLDAIRESDSPRQHPVTDPVEQIELAERQDWKCGYCGNRIDSSLAHDDPHSLDVDVDSMHGGVPSGEHQHPIAAHKECAARARLRLEKRIDLLMLGRATTQHAGESFRIASLERLYAESPWMKE